MRRPSTTACGTVAQIQEEHRAKPGGSPGRSWLVHTYASGDFGQWLAPAALNPANAHALWFDSTGLRWKRWAWLARAASKTADLPRVAVRLGTLPSQGVAQSERRRWNMTEVAGNRHPDQYPRRMEAVRKSRPCSSLTPTANRSDRRCRELSRDSHRPTRVDAECQWSRRYWCTDLLGKQATSHGVQGSIP